jgi:hypothetical protein
MNETKLNFLKNDLVFHLKHLAPDAMGKWGVMNGQQMVEHFTDMIRIASGRKKYNGTLDEEIIKKNYGFMMTDKPFRENTKNPLLPEIPPPVTHNTMQQSIEGLKQELNYLFEQYESKPDLRTHNPIFGDLNFEEQVQLLHKHAMHHLKQFGLVD